MHGDFSGIGVANIKERLRFYYGDASKVLCQSNGKSYNKIYCAVLHAFEHDGSGRAAQHALSRHHCRK